MPWQNFSIWRGRLPHWRADEVLYYVTFRHRRALTETERDELFRQLLKPEASKWNLEILCVRPEVTELMVRLGVDKLGKPHELSDIVEKAKLKAGKRIIKESGERFPPFYQESFDRIVRDESETEERWMQILEGPVHEELVTEPDLYPYLWVPAKP